MSGRLARRLLKEQSATKQNAVLEDSENESIESPRNRNQINLFDLLGEDVRKFRFPYQSLFFHRRAYLLCCFSLSIKVSF